MSAFEAVGMAFVIFTSTLSSIGIIYLAVIGLRSVVKQANVGKNLSADLKLSDSEIEKLGRSR